MRNWLRRLFCRHPSQQHVRDIYGDEIIHSGGKRSVWECLDCGATVYSERLSHGAYRFADVPYRWQSD